MRDTPNLSVRLQRYIWILEQLPHRFTRFEDFEAAWENAQDAQSSRQKLSRRTFYNYLKDLRDHYGIEIGYSSTEKRYTCRVLEDNGLSKAEKAIGKMILGMADSHLEEAEQTLARQGRLIQTAIGKKTPQYREAVEAMHEGRVLLFRYQNAEKLDPLVHRVRPLAVKYYEKFWYLWGEDITQPQDNLPFKDIAVTHGRKFFALNGRIKEFLYCNERFEFPHGENLLEEFKDYYGVMTGSRAEGRILPCTVVLKVYTNRNKHNYYLENPIHPSQEEISRTIIGQDYRHPYSHLLFRYKVAPTFDFIQKLLSDGQDIEVVEPESLREKMKQNIMEMQQRY